MRRRVSWGEATDWSVMRLGFIVSELPSQGDLVIIMWLRGFYRIARKKWGWVFAFGGGIVYCVPAAVAFPCFVIGLLAFPLCGGAPTFLCRPQRKVRKRKRLYTANS